MNNEPIRYFEPNNLEYNAEDLSIGISLSIEYLERALVPSTTSVGSVNILYGNKNETMLTTSYTDITVLELEGGGNKESIGIENINIKYNTWYFPEVSIKFVDIRGNSVFNPMEMTNNETTKYNAKGSFLKGFFSFPYPIFYLTVKGFFGRPMTYRLTVKDVPKAVFNSQTGNFELSVNFIGHMYYYLTDIPMSLVMLAPYIEYGGNNRDMGTFENNNTKIPTFIEFISESAKTIKALNTDESYAQLQNEYDEKNKQLEKLEALKKNVQELDRLLPISYVISADTANIDKCTFVKKTAVSQNTEDIVKTIGLIEQHFKNSLIQSYVKKLILYKNDDILGITNGGSHFYNSKKDLDTINDGIIVLSGDLQDIDNEILEKEGEIVLKSYSFTPTLKEIMEITLSHLEKLRKNMETCLQDINTDSPNRKLSKIISHKTDSNVINNEATAFPFLSFLNSNGEYVWIGETDAINFTERHFVETVIKQTTNFQSDIRAAEKEFDFTESMIKGYPNTEVKSFLIDEGNVYKQEMDGNLVNYCKQIESSVLPPVFSTIAKRFITSYVFNDAEYSKDVLPKIEVCKLLNCGFNKDVYTLESVWGNNGNNNLYVNFCEDCKKHYNNIIGSDTEWEYDDRWWVSHRTSQAEGAERSAIAGGGLYVYTKKIPDTMTVLRVASLEWLCFNNFITDYSDPDNNACIKILRDKYWYIPKAMYSFNDGNIIDGIVTDNLKTVAFLEKNNIPSDEYTKFFPISQPDFTKIITVSDANFVIEGEDFIIDDAGNVKNFNNIDTWCDKTPVEFKIDKTINFDNYFDDLSSDDICGFFFKECLKFKIDYDRLVNAVQRGGQQLYSAAAVLFLGYEREIEWPRELNYQWGASETLNGKPIGNRTMDEAYELIEPHMFMWCFANVFSDVYKKYKEEYANQIKDFFQKRYNNTQERNAYLKRLLKMHVFIDYKTYMPNATTETNIFKLEEDINTDAITYINSFMEEMRRKLVIENTKEEPRVNTSLSDERKLSIYDIFKNLYDRWKYGAEEFNGNVNKHDKITIDDFVFRDNLGRDIGNELNVNIENLVSLLMRISKGEINMTVYEFIHNICQQADCLLLPLPSNVFSMVDTKDKIKDVFTPYNYSYVNTNEIKSNFVVTYRQKDSQHLNFSPNESSYMDDGIDFTNKISVSDIDAGAFGVTYGFNKQRFFKDIQVSMDKPQVTEQSIATTLHIAENGDKSGSKKLGVSYHDIFDTFSNHSYQCSVEMLGDAQILPLMYFQLNNIPFFKGGYMITSVEHEIKSGNMTTKFTGNRLNRNQFKIKNSPLEVNIRGTSGPTTIDYSEIGGEFISEFFTMNELIHSSYAITHNLNNTPGKVEVKNLQKLASTILDKIRSKYGHVIIVINAFRSKDVNEGVGGAKNSQHRKGEAADIQTKNNVENGKLFKLIERMILNGEITVGQLIWEYGDCKNPEWIHVSLPTSQKTNDLLRAKRDGNGKTHYIPYEEC